MQSWRAGLDAALDWGRERQEVILRRLSVVRDFLRTADSKVDRQMRAADPERAQVVDGERERQAAELDRKAAEKAMQEARERIEARQKQAQERPKSQRELDREKRMEQAERQIAEKRAQNRSRGRAVAAEWSCNVPGEGPVRPRRTGNSSENEVAGVEIGSKDSGRGYGCPVDGDFGPSGSVRGDGQITNSGCRCCTDVDKVFP